MTSMDRSGRNEMDKVRAGWREMVAHYRPKVADLLVALAYRIDPARPGARKVNGGWQVDFGGVPLAKITAGSITDVRPTRP